MEAGTAEEDYQRNSRTKCAASLILAITDNLFLLYSVLMTRVLSNMWLIVLPVHETRFTICNSLFRLCWSSCSVSACHISRYLHGLTRYAALRMGVPRGVMGTRRSTDTSSLSSTLSSSSPVRFLPCSTSNWPSLTLVTVFFY